MSKQTVNVLLVDDSSTIAQAVTAMLYEDALLSFKVTHAESLGAAVAVLREQIPDVILTDLVMSDTSNLQAVEGLRVCAPKLPLVVMTGTIEDHEMALEAVRLGAQDYLFKDQLEAGMLRRVLVYAIERNQIQLRLKQAYEDLRSMQDQLVQAEKMISLGRLTAGMAHELLNPLNIVIQGVNYFQNRPHVNHTDLEVAKTITDGIERAKYIVQAAMRFSEGKLAKCEPTKMRDIISCAFENVHALISRQNITIRKDVPQDLGEIEGDKNALAEALSHLLTNALQAMPEGGTLTIRAWQATFENRSGKPGVLVVSKMPSGASAIACQVQDTGGGIAKEHLSKVFDPFYTTHPMTNSQGLGLSLARSIVEAHGGALAIESLPGQGTLATLYIPVPSVSAG